jgi:hypothetical protein
LDLGGLKNQQSAGIFGKRYIMLDNAPAPQGNALGRAAPAVLAETSPARMSLRKTKDRKPKTANCLL